MISVFIGVLALSMMAYGAGALGWYAAMGEPRKFWFYGGGGLLVGLILVFVSGALS